MRTIAYGLYRMSYTIRTRPRSADERSDRTGRRRRRGRTRELRLRAGPGTADRQVRLLRGRVRVRLDRHRDLHHVRVHADHLRPAADLDLADRHGPAARGRPGPRGAGLPDPGDRVLLPVDVPAGQPAAGLDHRL